jgi:hypothetical protein
MGEILQLLIEFLRGCSHRICMLRSSVQPAEHNARDLRRARRPRRRCPRVSPRKAPTGRGLYAEAFFFLKNHAGKPS